MPADASVVLDVSYSADGAVNLSVSPASQSLTIAKVPAGTTRTIEVTFTAGTEQPNSGTAVNVTGVAALSMPANSRAGMPPQVNSNNRIVVQK